MKVTVVELPELADQLESAMAELAEHVKIENSDFLLLPEMPFHPWLAYDKEVSRAKWQAAVDAHAEWMSRLAAFDVDMIAGSSPVIEEGKPYNDAFLLEKGSSPRFLHRKYYLPDEGGFWEATWYERAKDLRFEAQSIGSTKVGAMICSDLWFTEHARSYAKQGVQILVNPRATESGSLDKWLAGGRAAAVMSGAYCLSSNRIGDGKGFKWGGMGWIVDPNGNVMGKTSSSEPFLTLEIDLSLADEAKSSYPRYVKE